MWREEATVAVPTIDHIDKDSFELLYDPPDDDHDVWVGGFTWRLEFDWILLPTNQFPQLKSRAEPIKWVKKTGKKSSFFTLPSFHSTTSISTSYSHYFVSSASTSFPPPSIPPQQSHNGRRHIRHQQVFLPTPRLL